jgi:hypothetical protein
MTRAYPWCGLGRADEQHTEDFVAEIDPDGQWLTIAAQLIGEVAEITFNGTKQRRRVDASGRADFDSPISADDGWSNRGTFSGDAEGFTAAKRGCLRLSR